MYGKTSGASSISSSSTADVLVVELAVEVDVKVSVVALVVVVTVTVGAVGAADVVMPMATANSATRLLHVTLDDGLM